MKVVIVGKRKVSYVQKTTGELKEGMELYCTAPKDGVEGVACDTIWVPKASQFYGSLEQMNLSKPVKASIVNEIPLGGRFPQMTELTLEPA
jgi:hypothetical protein